MFYYFQDKHKLLEGNLEFKEHKYMFNSSEKELYSVGFLDISSHKSPAYFWQADNGKMQTRLSSNLILIHNFNKTAKTKHVM